MTKRDKGNIAGGIFVNYGELHDKGLGVRAAVGKFDSSDSNERFSQMFTIVKIKNQKFEDMKNLKYCLEL